jgi:hypothetical protein
LNAVAIKRGKVDSLLQQHSIIQDYITGYQIQIHLATLASSESSSPMMVIMISRFLKCQLKGPRRGDRGGGFGRSQSSQEAGDHYHHHPEAQRHYEASYAVVACPTL